MDKIEIKYMPVCECGHGVEIHGIMSGCHDCDCEKGYIQVYEEEYSKLKELCSQLEKKIQILE